jgi:hypothetical protein
MNERIRELAEQAVEQVCSKRTQSDGQIERAWHPDHFNQVFAELIVAECLAHGKLTQSQAVVNGSEEYNAGREMGIEVFMNKIRNHFGVED